MIDAIIIANSITDKSITSSHHMRLTFADGEIANIQSILSRLKKNGKPNANVTWEKVPRLNGIYLWQLLSSHGYQTLLINNYYDELDTFASNLKNNPRFIIVSTTFIYKKQLLMNLLSDLRQKAPKSYIIVGGPFVRNSYFLYQKYNIDLKEKIKEDYLFFDPNEICDANLFITRLDGEQILLEVMERISHNLQINDIPDIVQKGKHGYWFGDNFRERSKAVPIRIDWQSLPEAFFSSGVIPIQASYGCPYDCAFCDFVKDREKFYIKEADELITELKTVKSRGARYIWFTDDNFMLGKKNLNPFLKRLIAENLKLKWISFIRASSLHNVDFALLKKSGCIDVQIGLESGDPLILKNMNKRASPQLYSRIIHKLLEAGINCSVYFIFGFPGETRESVNRTIGFIKSIECKNAEGYLQWSLLPYYLNPLSPVYEAKSNYGIQGYMSRWTHGTMSSEEAVEITKRVFYELDNSSAIYRGDDLEIIYNLPSKTLKKFIITRHRLNKEKLINGMEDEEILQVFSVILEGAIGEKGRADLSNNVINYN